MNDDGHVLAIERADIPGAWQLPQGGVDAGEEDGAEEVVGRDRGRDRAAWPPSGDMQVGEVD